MRPMPFSVETQVQTQAQTATALPAMPAVLSAVALMRGQAVLQIEHAGERYQLRLTKNGKLILTK